MDRRHDPATRDAPGLVVAPYSAVAPYPAAAVLTAWVNSLRGAGARVEPPASILSFDEPVLPAAAEMPFWPEARTTLRQAVAAVPHQWWPARCALPVPGDLGGLPAGAPRALSAGQAVVWSHAGASIVLSPVTLPGGDRMWWAERTSTVAPPPPDQREVTRAIMGALERCVALAESSVLPHQASRTATAAKVAELPVPLPPTATGDAATLARQSAIVLAIVTTAMGSMPDTTEVLELREALVPLGRAARQGLSVAFSVTRGR